MDTTPSPTLTTQDEQDRIWNTLQTQTPSVFDENYGRLAFLISKIPSGSSVLDIGIGNGTFEDLALKKGITVSILDPSASSVERVKQKYSLSEERAKTGYASAIPYKNNHFDFVVVSEVLEHIPDNALIPSLLEISRVLKPQGKILGTVPSNEVLSNSLVVCPHCGHTHHRWGHVRSFSEHTLLALLQDHFSVENIVRKKFVTWHRRTLLVKVVTVAKLIAHTLGVRLPDESLYFIAAKLS